MESPVGSATQTAGQSNRLWPVRNLEWTMVEENSSSAEVDASRSQYEPDATLLNPDNSSTAAAVQENETLATANEMKSAEWQVIFDEIRQMLYASPVRTTEEKLRSSSSPSPRTSIAPGTKSVSSEVDKLFSLATFIDLEPGMENAFSRGLENLIERHGDPALSEIQSFILEEKTKSSIAMEALQYIGRMDSNRWKTERRKLLEQCLLRSRSAWVRDGAGLGLASLDDPRSIRAVKTAIAKESSNMLKNDLESVLDQLEKTRSES